MLTPDTGHSWADGQLATDYKYTQLYNLDFNNMFKLIPCCILVKQEGFNFKSVCVGRAIERVC